MVTPPRLLKRLLSAGQRGRLTRLMVATDFSMRAELALARALRLPWETGLRSCSPCLELVPGRALRATCPWRGAA